MSDTAHGMQDGRNIDLDTMTVHELAAHIEAAQAKLKRKQDAARGSLLAKWKQEAAEHNISFEEMMPGVKGQPARKHSAGEKLPVKFKGPSGETWSGRGRLPTWLRQAEADGRTRQEFAI